jgi:putative heme-binding domain-containing protein
MPRSKYSALLASAIAGLILPLGIVAQDHAGHYSQEAIERGSRLDGVNCVFCHGLNGDNTAGVDLKSGKFRSAASDEDLAKVITGGLPGTAMPPHKLNAAEVEGVIAYVRNMRDFNSRNVLVGDPARGRGVYTDRGACPECHRIDGVGGRGGPDLSEIGAIRAANALERRLLNPTASMLPRNRPVRAVTRSGQTITGRRLNEDFYTVQLIDTQERLVSLDKSQLREYKVLTTSPMPSFNGRLSSQEIADVIAYLLTLKGAR